MARKDGMVNKEFTHRELVIIAYKWVLANASCGVAFRELSCGWDPNRKSLLLRNWRHFSKEFEFAPYAIKKNFQGIFSIQIPSDVEIISKPEIKSFYDKYGDNEVF